MSVTPPVYIVTPQIICIIVVLKVLKGRVGRYKIIVINYIYKMANFNYIL